MIDIHPPQHAPMTRREFFTHLGIVVLGILIAIGLEQAVELLHQHQQVREARLMLRQELAQNRTILAHDMTNVDNHLSTLYNDLAVVARARDHKSLPGDQIVHIFGSVPFQAEAWQTIHASNVSEHMDPDELAEYGALYQKQQTISDMLTNTNDQLQVSLSPLVASEDLQINPRVDTSAQIEEIESHTDTRRDWLMPSTS